MHNPESVLENEKQKLLWDFEIQTDHLISSRQPDLVIINKKKRTCRIGDFAISADHRVKLKESEKNEKYLGLVRILKILRDEENDGDTNVIGVLGDTKELIQGLDDLEIKGRVETIQTTLLLRSTRILGRVMET